jgi:hypothetical protein
LLADLVGGDAVQKFMAFYRDGFEVVSINGMIGAFPEQGEAACFKIADKITPFDGHRQGPRAAVRSRHRRGGFPCLLPIGQNHFV